MSNGLAGLYFQSIGVCFLPNWLVFCVQLACISQLNRITCMYQASLACTTLACIFRPTSFLIYIIPNILTCMLPSLPLIPNLLVFHVTLAFILQGCQASIELACSSCHTGFHFTGVSVSKWLVFHVTLAFISQGCST